MEPCFDLNDLDRVMASIEKGDRPAHLDACPRCRALVRSASAFLNPPDIPSGCDPKEAARRLDIPAILGFSPPADEPSAAAPSRAQHPRALRSMPRIRLWAPWLRPLWAAGLVIVVFLFVRQIGNEPIPEGRSGVLRGEQAAPSRTVEPVASRSGAAGTILTWRSFPEADGYVVVLFGPDLAETVRRAIGRDTTAVIGSGDGSISPGAAPAAYWQILAMRDGREIARSAPKPLIPR